MQDHQEEFDRVAAVMLSMEENGPFVTLNYAAKECGVSLDTLRSAARDGRMPAVKLPRGYIVRLAVVKARIGLVGRGDWLRRQAKKRMEDHE